MKKFIISFITLITFFSYVLSASATEDKGVIYPIKLNEIAPFEGLLLSPIAVASILSDKKFNEERCQLQVKQCEEKSKIDLETLSEQEKLKIEKREAEFLKEKTDSYTKIKILEDTIKQKDELIQKQQKSESNVAYYTAGGFITGILTVMAASKIFN